jgi:formimidoylglutamate deiminase
LFTYATESGAAALRAPGGSLEAGRPADFFTIDLDDLSIAGADQDSLLTNIVFAAERTAVRDVFVAGRAVVEDSHHHLEEQIVRDFSELQRRLWR